MAAAKIAPSMLSSDFANLATEAERMLRLGADWLHMDIMVRSPPPPAIPVHHWSLVLATDPRNSLSG